MLRGIAGAKTLSCHIKNYACSSTWTYSKLWNEHYCISEWQHVQNKWFSHSLTHYFVGVESKVGRYKQAGNHLALPEPPSLVVLARYNSHILPADCQLGRWCTHLSSSSSLSGLSSLIQPNVSWFQYFLSESLTNLERWSNSYQRERKRQRVALLYVLCQNRVTYPFWPCETRVFRAFLFTWVARSGLLSLKRIRLHDS